MRTSSTSEGNFRTSQRRRLRLPPGFVFGARFFACLLLLSCLFWALSLHEHLGPVQRVTAGLSALVARGLGGQITAQGDALMTSSLTIQVNYECTGIFVCMLYVSFVLAYPASWRARLSGLLIGLPLFFLVNVLRLATLARITAVYPAAFFYLHEYVWQGILAVFVLVGAIAWAEHLG